MAFVTLNIFSQTLGKSTEVYAVVPQRHTHGQIGVESAASGERLKCVYLLHGLSDDHTAWLRRTSVERYAAERGVAVIMPDAGRSYYCDCPGGSYYQYVARELPLVMRELLPLSAEREDNFIAGLSMGGYGALKIALREEGAFCAAAALSPVGDIKGAVENRDRSMFEPIFGESCDVPEEDDVLHLAGRCGVRPRLYMEIGTEDGLYLNNLPVRERFCRLGYDFTYRESQGSHNWEFWDAGIRHALDWMLAE